MNVEWSITIGQLVTIGFTVASVFAGVVAWRQQTIAVSAKLDALEMAVGKRLDKLEKALEETSNALTTRVSNLETNLHSLELQITRDYVSRTLLTEGRLHRTPKPAEIKTLVDTHGWDAVEERWWWLSRRTLNAMIKPLQETG